MGRYTEKYWDNSMPGADMITAVATAGLSTLMDDSGPSYGCEITDSETGLVGTTHQWRSSKAKAREEAWEDLMEKQAGHYKEQENEYKKSKERSYETTSTGEGSDLITVLVKGAVYVLIAVGVLWLIFSVAIPLLIINIALITLITGLAKKNLQKFVFPLSSLGMIFLIVDFNKGWFTKTLATNVSFLSGAIPFFFYLNIIAGLTAGYFLIRDMLNKKNPPVEGEKEFSKRNLIVIGCLLVAAVSIIGLQQYFDSPAPAINDDAVREYKPETIIATTTPIQDNAATQIQPNQQEPEIITNPSTEILPDNTVTTNNTVTTDNKVATDNTTVQTENTKQTENTIGQYENAQTEPLNNGADEKNNAVLDIMGADFIALDYKKAKEYGVAGGVIINKINAGALNNQTRMKDGFVVLKINGKVVKSVADMNKVTGTATGNDIIISGFYPGYDGTYEYPINLSKQ